MRGPDGRFLLTALALLAGCWGLWGWLDLSHRGQAGFETDGNHRVTQVQADSPAAAAGLATGDRISHFDGVSTRDSAALSRLPPKRPGDRQTITVERGDEQLQLVVAYGRVSAREVAETRASSLVACGFIFFPLLAFLRHPSDATRLLALMGVGLGLALVESPSMAGFGMRAISATVITLFVLLGLAAMLRFLILFPPLPAAKQPWFTGTYTRRLVYLPAFLLWLLLAWRLLFTPAATPLLNLFTQVFAGLVMGAYLLASLYRFLRNYSRTDSALRKALALNGMLWGTVAGILPGLVARLVEAFSPQAALPGQDYYFISLVLIPLTWARSASRAFRPPV